MAKDHDQLRTCLLGRVFETAENVRIDNASDNTSVECVAVVQIEDIINVDTRVDAVYKCGERVLPFSGLLDLGPVVRVILSLPSGEPRVTFLQSCERRMRRHLRLRFFSLN